MLLIPSSETLEQESYERMENLRIIAFGDEQQNIQKLIQEGRHAELCGKMRTLLELLKIWFGHPKK